MERKSILKYAKEVLLNNFIGPDELRRISQRVGYSIPSEVPIIPYNIDEIDSATILVLGLGYFQDQRPINILNLRDKFGNDPNIQEPCFYNQDWYLKEDFVKKTLDYRWYLIKRNLLHESKGRNPSEFQDKFNFPSAILCSYVFFNYYLLFNEKLWNNEYVWCADTDYNSDRIYVGCYSKPSGLNKNGFEIHRHLSIKPNYGVIEIK